MRGGCTALHGDNSSSSTSSDDTTATAARFTTTGCSVSAAAGGIESVDIRSLLASIGSSLDVSTGTSLTLSVGVGSDFGLLGGRSRTALHEMQHQQQQQQQLLMSATAADAMFSEFQRIDFSPPSSVAGGGTAVEDEMAAGAASSMTMRKSANMTERVVVPSSEHVAEIVGRQGCKIKALRNKTNTYIKTPVRGEEPVFVVTGRREDVDAARHEIISAAEHFSHIRATRSSRHGFSSGSHDSPPLTADLMQPSTTSTCAATRRRTPSPEHVNRNGRHHHNTSQHSQSHQMNSPSSGGDHQQVTIGVRVPMSMVGLVVGPKGATIKRIQQDTGTYIVTPGRQKDPVFEVIGSTVGVERARRQIEAYLETRVGPSTAAEQTVSTATSGSTDWLGNLVVDTAADTSAVDCGYRVKYRPQLQHQQLLVGGGRSATTWLTDGGNISPTSSIFRDDAVTLPQHLERGGVFQIAESIPTAAGDDQLETRDDLLSWFYERMRFDNSVANNTSQFSLQQQQQQQQQYHRQQQSSGTHWPSSTSVTVEEVGHSFDDDNDVDSYGELADSPDPWNYILSAAGMLPDGQRRRRGGHQLHGNDAVADTSSAFWSANELDQSAVDRATRLLLANGGRKSEVTPGILISGGVARYPSYCGGGVGGIILGGGGGRVCGAGEEGRGSEETSPSSTSPVESFSAGSSSG